MTFTFYFEINKQFICIICYHLLEHREQQENQARWLSGKDFLIFFFSYAHSGHRQGLKPSNQKQENFLHDFRFLTTASRESQCELGGGPLTVRTTDRQHAGYSRSFSMDGVVRTETLETLETLVHWCW